MPAPISSERKINLREKWSSNWKVNHRSMQRKTAANEQDKVHKLLFSIYASSEKNRMLACRFGEHRDNSRNSQSVFLVVYMSKGKLTKGVSRSCQAIIICKKLPGAGSVGYKLALQLFPLGCRQGEDKFSADSFGTDDVDIFIMCLNNFFYDRESKTGTLLVLSTGQVGFVETLSLIHI